MVKIDELKFDEKGLIPAIVVDEGTGKERVIVNLVCLLIYICVGIEKFF